MGQVAVTFKIMPESPETDLELIKNEIKQINIKSMEIKQIKEEPIGFGLEVIKLLLLVPDTSGIANEIEEKLRKISGVKEVETEGIGLV